MSNLFTPKKLGNVMIKNRFIHSACEDNMATENGRVTDEIAHKLQRLAAGEIGLIIWSHLAVHPSGRTSRFQSAIYSDELLPGLKRAVRSVQDVGGKIAFQLGHGGVQSAKAVAQELLMGPSSMTASQIAQIITAFEAAARRSLEAGADAVQLHAAHGYLINGFLSPHVNKRQDKWGGSDANRFRFLKEIITAVRKVLPDGFPLLVKLNSDDCVGDTGITPGLAATYAKWLKELAVDGLEISCGSSSSPYFMNMCRGDVPVNEIAAGFPEAKQAQVAAGLGKLSGKFKLEGPYNVAAAKALRPVLGDTPIFAVGGWRDLKQMEDAVKNGDTDFIAMCRPFIREPGLIKRFRQGKTDKASCKNCNKCLAALTNNIPVRCYEKKFPVKQP